MKSGKRGNCIWDIKYKRRIKEIQRISGHSVVLSIQRLDLLSSVYFPRKSFIDTPRDSSA